jgi:hypothetical protein
MHPQRHRRGIFVEKPSQKIIQPQRGGIFGKSFIRQPFSPPAATILKKAGNVKILSSGEKTGKGER